MDHYFAIGVNTNEVQVYCPPKRFLNKQVSVHSLLFQILIDRRCMLQLVTLLWAVASTSRAYFQIANNKRTVYLRGCKLGFVN